MGRYKDSLSSCHCWIRKIRHIFFYFSLVQRFNQRFLIYKKVSCKIKEYHTVFHFFESFFINHLFCAVKKRHMNGNIITLRINFVQSFAVVYGSGKIPGCVNGYVRVVSIYVHAKTGSCVCYHCADCAKSDDSQLLSADLAAGKLFFLFFRQLVNIFFIFFLFYPLDTAHNVS